MAVCLFIKTNKLNNQSMNQFMNATKYLSIIALFILTSCAQNNETARAQSESDLDKAPNFEVTTIDGDTISLSQSLADGKPVVVYFTASWCPTCARNWPAMSEVYPEFEDRLTLVAISIDPTDTEEVIRNLSEEKDFRFPSTSGHPEIMMDFGVSGQATTVGVDRDGNIAFKRPGEALSSDEFRELFTSLVE
tara:strand:- start:21098 stop:21673 length:576 start_codon:yes stop_codon:yes gene_type:complete